MHSHFVGFVMLRFKCFCQFYNIFRTECGANSGEDATLTPGQQSSSQDSLDNAKTVHQCDGLPHVEIQNLCSCKSSFVLCLTISLDNAKTVHQCDGLPHVEIQNLCSCKSSFVLCLTISHHTCIDT